MHLILQTLHYMCLKQFYMMLYEEIRNIFISVQAFKILFRILIRTK